LAYAFLNIGGSDEKAVKLAQKAYEFDPNNPAVMDTYATALLVLKNYEQAETLLLKAIAIKAEQEKVPSMENYYHLAQALHGLGRSDEARINLQNALTTLNEREDLEAQKWRKRINDLSKLLG